MTRRRGRLITFEGPEKSGKSTQARLLGGFLEKKGYRTVFVREPGSTPIGEKIRRVLLDKRHKRMTASAEMFLYMAARAQLVEEVIRPALKKGEVVLCDRFLDSTLAYQGYGLGFDHGFIKTVGRFVTAGLEPDLTLLLDFWASQAVLKNSRRRDRIERRPDVFHRRVKRGYFALAKASGGRIKVIRVQPQIRQTQELIREVVLRCLLKR